MILLAALLCNYGRGFCLIDVGTEGIRQIDDMGGESARSEMQVGRPSKSTSSFNLYSILRRSAPAEGSFVYNDGPVGNPNGNLG